MIRTQLEVTNPKGIHARPSALIVQATKTFRSRILFECRGETVDATDIMEVLSLGAACGDVLGITIDGPDEQDALTRLQDIFALNFNDE